MRLRKEAEEEADELCVALEHEARRGEVREEDVREAGAHRASAPPGVDHREHAVVVGGVHVPQAHGTTPEPMGRLAGPLGEPGGTDREQHAAALGAEQVGRGPSARCGSSAWICGASSRTAHGVAPAARRSSCSVVMPASSTVPAVTCALTVGPSGAGTTNLEGGCEARVSAARRSRLRDVQPIVRSAFGPRHSAGIGAEASSLR